MATVYVVMVGSGDTYRIERVYLDSDQGLRVSPRTTWHRACGTGPGGGMADRWPAGRLRRPLLARRWWARVPVAKRVAAHDHPCPRRPSGHTAENDFRYFGRRDGKQSPCRLGFCRPRAPCPCWTDAPCNGSATTSWAAQRWATRGLPQPHRSGRQPQVHRAHAGRHRARRAAAVADQQPCPHLAVKLADGEPGYPPWAPTTRPPEPSPAVVFDADCLINAAGMASGRRPDGRPIRYPLISISTHPKIFCRLHLVVAKRLVTMGSKYDPIIRSCYTARR